MFRKYFSTVLLGLLSLAASACWYRKSNYNDYIASVNNLQRHISSVDITQDAQGRRIESIEYTVTNASGLGFVDLPVTAIMKITSEKPIYVQAVDDDAAQDEPRATKLDARLEYRILPNGNWTTVSEFSIETGRLPESYPPAPYLGRNNIFPKGLKKGDKIMVRLYVTDNAGWQSGDPASKCDARASASSGYTYRYEYPGYRYVVRNVVTDIVGESDLGGGWLPHYVVVLEYSGEERPIN